MQGMELLEFCSAAAIRGILDHPGVIPVGIGQSRRKLAWMDGVTIRSSKATSSSRQKG